MLTMTRQHVVDQQREQAPSDSPAQPLTDRVLQQLAAGGSVHEIASECGTSEVFVRTILDHFVRLGVVGAAQSLCASGLGACSPGGGESVEAQIHCAGCPLAIRRRR